MRRELKKLLKEMRSSGDVTAAVAVISEPDRELARASVGLSPTLTKPVYQRFDLGSLTKPLVATLAISDHVTDGLPLDVPLQEWFSEELHPDLAGKTGEDLLSHRAGFIPWFPFYAVCADRSQVRAALLAGEAGEHRLLGAEEGTYSDLGYMLWVFLYEQLHPPGAFGPLFDQVITPLELEWMAMAPVGRSRRGSVEKDVPVVPCRLDNGQEVELAAELGIEVAPEGRVFKGEAQDGNARFLARGIEHPVPGHAGLFGSAEDLVRFGAEWLVPRDMLSLGDFRERMFEGRAETGAEPRGERSYGLGWQLWSEDGAAAPLSPRAFGHYGFPGGSLWLDPEPEPGLIHVLLAHKSRSEVDLTRWRKRFHALRP